MSGQEREALTSEEFYRRTSWRVGTLVGDARDLSRKGVIVKRGGRFWASRDRLPMVRWDGIIPSEEVEWERLILYTLEHVRVVSDV